MATFVLIHGSWHGAWCWYKITNRLEAKGHAVYAPDMPAHGRNWGVQKNIGLEDYVHTTCTAIDRAQEPVVLVAHSRGGIVASQTAEARADRVARLVYLAAFLIPDGRRVVDYSPSDTDSLVRENLDINPEAGFDMLRRSAFRETLYHDCSDDDVALAHLLLTPEPLRPAVTPLQLTEERFGRVSRFYIELAADRAVSPSLQRRMYGAMPCQRVMRLDASHSAYFSRPDELTAHLLSVL